MALNKKIRCPEIGDMIKMTVPVTDNGRYESKTFEVVGVYPHHIVCKDRLGVKESFSNADLVTKGLAYMG